MLSTYISTRPKYRQKMSTCIVWLIADYCSKVHKMTSPLSGVNCNFADFSLLLPRSLDSPQNTTLLDHYIYNVKHHNKFPTPTLQRALLSIWKSTEEKKCLDALSLDYRPVTYLCMSASGFSYSFSKFKKFISRPRMS